MYYEERKINGVWMWRGTPNGPWHTFTDGVRRQKMRDDLLAMAERANSHRERNSLRRFGLGWFAAECWEFADELSERITS